MEGSRYQAFISYRHEDSSGLAIKLEKALRRYAQPMYKPPIRIFRDEKQIGAGQDLRGTIERALKDSAFLLYVATCGAAESPYVRKELDFWCGTLERQDRLIIVWQKDHLVADPVHDSLDWAASDAIPASLAPLLQGIPVWLDFTWVVDEHDLDLGHPRFKSQINSIAARLRGVPPEELNGEEIRVHRRNIRLRNTGIGILVAALVAATGAGFIAWQQKQTAMAERDRARSSALINASAKLRPSDFTLSLGFAAEAYALRPRDAREALLRSFYGSDGDIGEPYQQRLPHRSAVTAATFSADGELIGTGSSDGFIGLWSVDGKRHETLQAHRLGVLSVAFSADASQLFTTGQLDTAVRRWGLDGSALEPIDYRGAEFAFLAGSTDDGTMLAAFGGEHYRRGFVLWGPARDTLLRVEPEWPTYNRSVLLDVAFSSGNDAIVGLIKREGLLKLEYWDRVSGQHRPPAKRDQAGQPAGAPNQTGLDAPRFTGRLFGDGIVYLEASRDLWEDLDASQPSRLIRFAVSGDGQRFLRTSNDGTVRVWDAHGRQIAKFQVPGNLRGAALLTDRQEVLTLSGEDVLSVWSLDGERLRVFRGHAAAISTIRRSPGGQVLLTASLDGTAKLWPLGGQLAPACKTEFTNVAYAQFSPASENRLLVITRDRHAAFAFLGKVSMDSPLAGEEDVHEARFSPDGSRIVTLAGTRDQLGLWDAQGNSLGRCCGHQAALREVTFSPEGTHLLTTSDDGVIRLWTSDGEAVGTLADAGGRISRGLFSPDGERILIYGPAAGARLWNYREQLVSSTLPVGHQLTTAQYSPDGERMILTSQDGISFWDAAGNHLDSPFEKGSRGAYTTNWIGDGKSVVTTHPGGGIKVWNRDGVLRHAWRFPAETHFFGAEAAPDGSFLVIPGAGIRRLDGNSLGTLGRHRFLGFLPTGDLLVASNNEGIAEMAIHDRQGKQVTALGRLSGKVKWVGTSPAGRLIGILSDDGVLALRCTAAGIYSEVKDADFYRPAEDERGRHGIDWTASSVPER